MQLADTPDAGARTLEAIRRQMRHNTAGQDSVAIAFSGGVDSSLVAHVCARYADVTLLTVGFASSHDLEYSTRAAGLLRLPHHTRTISDATLKDAYRTIQEQIPAGLPISWYENGIAFHMIAGLAADHDIKRIITANGIDELFCGYDSYRRVFHSGEAAITHMMEQKTAAEIRMMESIGRVTQRRGVTMERPLLDDEFVRFACTIPIKEKVRGSDDYRRKHAIRQAAALAGLPDSICNKRKKALQYGTKIHPRLLRIIRRI